MAIYITVADVDTILGAVWAPAESKDEAVFEANAYLTAVSYTHLTLPTIYSV